LWRGWPWGWMRGCTRFALTIKGKR